MSLTESKLQKKGRIFSFLAGILFLLSFFSRYTVTGMAYLLNILVNDETYFWVKTPVLSFLLVGSPHAILNFWQILSFLIGVAGILLLASVCFVGKRNLFLLVVSGTLVVRAFSPLITLISYFVQTMLDGHIAFDRYFLLDVLNMTRYAVNLVTGVFGTSLIFVIALFCCLPKLRTKAFWMKWIFFVPALGMVLNYVICFGLDMIYMFVVGSRLRLHLGALSLPYSVLNLLQFFNPLGWIYIAAIFFFCLWMVRILPKKYKKSVLQTACDAPQHDSLLEENIPEELPVTACTEEAREAEQTAVFEEETPVTPKSTDLDPALAVAEGIKKYKELLDIGAITEEEYERVKKDLLGQ